MKKVIFFLFIIITVTLSACSSDRKNTVTNEVYNNESLSLSKTDKVISGEFNGSEVKSHDVCKFLFRNGMKFRNMVSIR
jgi:hypothetical protein